MNSLLALAARSLTMAVALVCGVLTTRLVIAEAGVAQYVLFTVLVGLPALLSFADLGSGAVLVNSLATKDDFRTDATVIAQTTAVGRIMLGFAGATMAVNSILLITGGWSIFLGAAAEVDGAALAAFLCITIYCLGVPLGLWTRLLLGMRRNHIVILVQGLVSPLTLLSVWALLHVGTERAFPFLAAGSFFATFAVAVLGYGLTGAMTRPLLGTAAGRLLRPRRYPGARVMDVGWPMLAQLLSPPIALGTQRLVIANFGTSDQVAEYGVAGQVFLALQGLVIAAGVALWPLYARRRHQGRQQRGPWVQAALFGGGAIIATLAVWAVGPWLFGFVSGGDVVVSTATILSFGLMITCIAVLNPLGMFIMDKPGIRFQVIPTLLMAFSSLGLSILLTPLLGAVGPLIANAAAVTVFQIVPFSVYILRSRSRLQSSSEDDVEPVAAELQAESPD
jgi:O-antigen/teichoic acid export membrane protein